MTKRTKQLNLRVSVETYEYLKSLENYSEYVRDLIDKDRLKQDSSYLNSEITKHESEIKRLETLKE